MSPMTASETAPELVLSSALDYMDRIVECGHRSILVNARTENISATDARARARNSIGRELGDFTLYIRHPSHVEEYAVTGGTARSAIHPVWNYLERGVDTLVPLLRGEWTGHMALDENGNTWPIGPEPGQEGYKVFITALPTGKSLSTRMLAKFFTDALASGLVVPKIYFDTVKALATGLNLGAHGVVYNPHYSSRYREVITGQGRRIPVDKIEELRKARNVLAAVGYTPEEVAQADLDELIRFNILSARWATENWQGSVMPVGPKARAGAGTKATA